MMMMVSVQFPKLPAKKTANHPATQRAPPVLLYWHAGTWTIRMCETRGRHPKSWIGECCVAAAAAAAAQKKRPIVPRRHLGNPPIGGPPSCHVKWPNLQKSRKEAWAKPRRVLKCVLPNPFWNCIPDQNKPWTILLLSKFFLKSLDTIWHPTILFWQRCRF